MFYALTSCLVAVTFLATEIKEITWRPKTRNLTNKDLELKMNTRKKARDSSNTWRDRSAMATCEGDRAPLTF